MELIQNVDVSNLLNDREIKISWTISTTVGITGYKVYRSAIPYGSFSLIATIDNPTTIEYTDTPSLIPINEWYYYIIEYTGVTDGPIPTSGVTFLDYNAFADANDPFTQTDEIYPDNEDMSYYFDEIRKRNLWLLQNDGEVMKLLQRRYEGTICPLISDEYGGQCPYPLGRPVGTNACYGTGYLYGYYSAYTIKVRRINAPRVLATDMSGLRVGMSPRFWTIYAPRVKMGDFFADNMNQRWEVKAVHNYHWRSLITHQEFDVELKGMGEMLYKVPIT